MQVQSTGSVSQSISSSISSSINTNVSTSANAINTSNDFFSYMTSTNTSTNTNTSNTSSSSSSSTTENTNSSNTTDKKTESTSKDTSKDKKTEGTSKKDSKKVNEEAAAESLVEAPVEEVTAEQLMLSMMAVVEEVLSGEEVEVALETGEVQVIDLKQAKLATNDLLFQEPESDGEVVEDESLLSNLQNVLTNGNIEVEAEVVEEVDESLIKDLENVLKNTETDETTKEEVVEEDGEEVKVKVETSDVETAPTIFAEKTADEEIVFIKVGDTQLDESWQKLMDDMAKEIIAKEAAGIEKFTVVLNPEGLGEVKIEILQLDGNLSVNLLCSQKGTAGVINDNIIGLVKILETNFGEDTKITVAEEPENAQEEMKQDDSDSKQEQKEDEVEEADEIEISFTERMRLGLMDIVSEVVSDEESSMVNF